MPSRFVPVATAPLEVARRHVNLTLPDLEVNLTALPDRLLDKVVTATETTRACFIVAALLSLAHCLVSRLWTRRYLRRHSHHLD
tara:strand:+ start:4219 stop:4470 length:252 start_codon:yes stop_codon:yes gene_type:complete